MLTVYKASAGSGKTFRLAIEYIKRLIINQTSYEHILAVTFTNKATEEMKMRILSQLYGLAHGLEDSRNYMSVILPELQQLNNEQPFTDEQVTEKFIEKRCAYALKSLLHHYNYFKVETIDRFFQTVLRNLARELDLTPNLRVELGDKEIEHEAVDIWIDKLTENDRELNWIIEYIRSTMDEEKAWNIIGKIKEFGETLLRDEFKEHSKAITDRFASTEEDFYTKYTSNLNKVRHEATKTINDAGKQLWDIIERHGMDEKSFAQGTRGVGGFIRKMSEQPIETLSINSYVSKALDPDDSNADNWVSKNTSEQIRSVCREQLRPQFIKVMHDFAIQQMKARSAAITLNHMSKLRLLRAIQQEIETQNRENDRFLLSDTQTLLSRMIGNNDSPFIYEKIGARLEHIMIDEFQDTSRIQWQNFKVLLDDCMAHGKDNLIVGDVKQSIYRWRSGDWRLLNNIEQQFDHDVKTESLKINRRSATRVIDFNNAFFRNAANSMTESLNGNCKPEDIEMVRHAYSDVEQEYPEGKEEEGYVEVKMFEEDSKEAETLEYITSTIVSLIEKGVRQNEIAILVRTNKYIPLIANHCMAQFRQHQSEEIRNIKIVSDEAYLLDASPAVNIIVDAIRLVVSPTDSIVRARLSLNYQRYVRQNKAEQTDLLYRGELPEAFDNHIDELATLPLYQMAEELYSIFSLSQMTDNSAFICYFFDSLTEYLVNSVGDTQTFITYWDQVMHKKKIESDSSAGIRILSIHKSKGLEYANVIVPFCDWILELPGLLWCEPTHEPFNQLPLIPLNYSKKDMTNTIYEPDYWNEHMQNCVDNLNLLYVAFTRAVNNMFITTTVGQKDTYRGQLIETIMDDVAKQLKADFDGTTLTFGTVKVNHDDGEKESKNVFLQPSGIQSVTVHTNEVKPEFRESNKSKDFTLTDEQEEQQQRSQYIEMGNVLHHLFSNIRTFDDLDSAMLQLEMDGLLYGQDITAEALHEHIKQSMNDKTIKDWFSGRWQIHNECSILTYNPETDSHEEHRPDRVMTDGNETIVVDFKLHSFKDKYRTQVREYMDLLRQMGHKNVRGFLWLVFSNKIIEVK